MSELKRLVAVLLAGTALVVVLPHGEAAAQQADDVDEIVLDDSDITDSSAENAGNEDASGEQGGVTKLKRLVVGSDRSNADITNVPAAVSTMDAETFQERFSGNANEAVRSMAGTFTREQAEQPGIIVNVRGMQGVGRVNTMIDGVPQTFKNLSGHGGTFDNMVYVDPNMLVGIDVARGSVSGNEGMGTLSGAANFRTIGVDDVLLPGKEYGGLVTLQTGTNGYNFSRLTALGYRHDLGNEGQVSVIGALSGSNHSNYKNGDGVWFPYDAAQRPQSGLFKFNFAPNAEHSLQLGGVFYENAFSVESTGYDWQIKNQTYTAKYAYQPGDNLIDLKVNAYLNITDIDMDAIKGGTFGGRQGTNTGIGLDVSNTSLWDINDTTSVKFFYGAALNSDDYKGNEHRGANPDGRLLKSGAFMDATLTHGIFGLITGLRYDAWNVEGITEFLKPGEPGCPVTSSGLCDGEALSRSGGEWNPKIGATITPQDWLQFYANYTYSMRPPTPQEMFYPGGHNFDGTGDPIYNNPNLEPERQRGLDIGVNLRGDGLLTADDMGYLKVGYFRNRIKNYITYAYDTDGQARWVNLPGTTTMDGVEIEGGYDMGTAYVKLSLTVANTKQPLGLSAGFGNDVGTLPDDFATIDAGMRFFEQKLTLGGRIRYTGESIQAYIDEENSIRRPDYTLVDVYGSWKITENFKAFFTVENVFDKAYWTANSGVNDILSGITNGRGRTFMVGATARF